MGTELYDRVKKVYDLIPEDHMLKPIIDDNLSSIAFAAPWGQDTWITEVMNNLRNNLKMEEDWEKEVYKVWMEV